jgi:hypothetical protein
MSGSAAEARSMSQVPQKTDGIAAGPKSSAVCHMPMVIDREAARLVEPPVWCHDGDHLQHRRGR